MKLTPQEIQLFRHNGIVAVASNLDKSAITESNLDAVLFSEPFLN